MKINEIGSTTVRQLQITYQFSSNSTILFHFAMLALFIFSPEHGGSARFL